MKACFFLLFVYPIVVFAQNQQVPAANGATDCPTFGKKNTSSKAGFFQYMRSNKPPKSEQQTVYRTSALPTLKPSADEEEAIAQRKQKRAERAAARRQRPSPNDPAREEEPIIASTADVKDQPVKLLVDEPIDAKAMTDRPVEMKTNKPIVSKTIAAPPADTKAMADKPADAKTVADKEASIENESSAKDAAKRAEERDKKVHKAARKEKIQHLFKKNNKRSSRKNVQKCPQF